MILAAVDDLMFSSRIRAAALAAGAAVTFVRDATGAVEKARGLKPALILLDLNARGLDPMDLLAALKSDPELAGIRVVGYVSHVQADVIAAARAAGIDDVLARSAFVARLPHLLAEAR
jgi:CheY-like chemotaxis protein